MSPENNSVQVVEYNTLMPENEIVIDIIEDMEENNVTAVIDKKFILGGKTDFDITKIIVEKMNKELPSLNLK